MSRFLDGVAKTLFYGFLAGAVLAAVGAMVCVFLFLPPQVKWIAASFLVGGSLFWWAGGRVIDQQQREVVEKYEREREAE